MPSKMIDGHSFNLVDTTIHMLSKNLPGMFYLQPGMFGKVICPAKNQSLEHDDRCVASDVQDGWQAMWKWLLGSSSARLANET